MSTICSQQCRALFDTEGDWALSKPYLSTSLCERTESYLVDCELSPNVPLENMERCLLDLQNALQSRKWKDGYTVSTLLKEQIPVASYLFLRIIRRAEKDITVNYSPHFEDPTMEDQWVSSIKRTKHPPLSRKFSAERAVYDLNKTRAIFERLQQLLAEDKKIGRLCHFVQSPYFANRSISLQPPSFDFKDGMMAFFGSALVVACFIRKF